jgi:hypothetical protein
VATSLGYVHSCSRGYLEGDPFSISCKYTGTLAIKSFQELHGHGMYVVRICPHFMNNSLLGCHSEFLCNKDADFGEEGTEKFW